MSDDYIPINCGLHSQYELHIMHGDRLKLEWKDDTGLEHIEVVRPYDIRIIEGAEYLIAEGQTHPTLHIRLDCIRHFTQQK